MPHSDKQEEWEKKWSDPAYAPKWRASAIPVELQRAIQHNWFTAGETLLDIGCGSGEITAWLASKGLRSTGIDFAQAAIDLCNASFSGQSGLHFQTMDITRPVTGTGPFDALFDRGCLHTLGSQSVPGYVENVGRSCKQRGKFLLLIKSPPQKGLSIDDARTQVAQQTARLFAPAFTVTRISRSEIQGGIVDGRQFVMPGIAAWMTRR